MHSNVIRWCFLAFALVSVPLMGILMTDATTVLAHSRPQRTTRQLLREINTAQTAAHHPNGGLDYVDRLKSLDPSRTPGPVQRAFSNYVSVLEAAEPNSPESSNAVIKAEAQLKQTAARYLKRR